MFNTYNDDIDVRRGIRQPDFTWGRSWSVMKAAQLSTNIDGPSPGENQHLPSDVGTDGAPLEVVWMNFLSIASVEAKPDESPPSCTLYFWPAV